MVEVLHLTRQLACYIAESGSIAPSRVQTAKSGSAYLGNPGLLADLLHIDAACRVTLYHAANQILHLWRRHWPAAELGTGQPAFTCPTMCFRAWRVALCHTPYQALRAWQSLATPRAWN